MQERMNIGDGSIIQHGMIRESWYIFLNLLIAIFLIYSWANNNRPCIENYDNPTVASSDAHYGVQVGFPMKTSADDIANISAIDPSLSTGSQGLLCNGM